MTTAHERTRSVIQTRQFLKALSSGLPAAGVPADVRREALRLLTHFPEDIHLDHAAIAWPQMWAPVSPPREGAPSYLELIVSLRELTGELPREADDGTGPGVQERRDNG